MPQQLFNLVLALSFFMKTIQTFRVLFAALFFCFVLQSRSAVNGTATVCANASATYSSTIAYPLGYTYNWSVNGAAQTVPSGPNIVVMWGPAGAGLVSLIVKDSYGTVVYSGSFPVIINPRPNPQIIVLNSNSCVYPLPPRPGDGTLTIQPDSTDVCYTACENVAYTYTTNLPIGSHTYSWSVYPSFAVSGTTVTGLGGIKVRWGTPMNSPVTLKLWEQDNTTGCSDTAYLCVRIIARPTASFSTFPAATASVVNICKNATVAFFDQSFVPLNSTLAGWLWNFGDGTSSTQQSPAHSYTAAGTYTVKLLAFNQCQCRDSMMITVNVQSQPGPDITCLSPLCYGSTAKYCTSFNCSPFSWSVTNGTITSGLATSCINVAWGNQGPGSITLQGSPCSGSCAFPTQVLIPILSQSLTITPGNNLSPSNPLPCINSTNTFSVQNIPGTTYSWSTSQGTILTGQGTNQISLFSGSITSSYSISVNYFNSFLGCNGVSTTTVFVGIPQAVAGNTLICLNGTPSLSTPIPNPLFFSYNIIDPNGVVVGSCGGNGFNCATSFSIPGIYTYSVNTLGACNNPYFFNVQVMPAVQQPTLTVNTSICPGQTVLYTGTPTSPNHFLKWAVTGGVPNQASGNAISVTWNTTGPWSMTVTQQAIMPPACESAPLVFNMSNTAPPTPAISGASLACENTQIAFSTSVTANTYNWVLNPANKGSIIPGSPPSNIVVQLNNATAGTATLLLQVVRCGLASTASKVISITPIPTPTISSTPTVCQNAPWGFFATTLGSSYSWSFGDGTSFNGQTAPHTYTAAGNYTVTLGVSDPGSCAGVTSYATRSISVLPAPVAGITSPNNLDGCPNGPFQYTLYALGQTLPGTPTFTWSPIISSTNSVLTSIAGLHSLTVSLNGCTSYTSAVVTITNCTQQPNGNGTNTPCPTGNVTFNYAIACNTVNFTPNISGSGNLVGWEFGDPANTQTTSMYPQFAYLSPGYYFVKLTARWPNPNPPYGDCYGDTTKQIVIPLKTNFTKYFSCGPGNTFMTNLVDQSTYVPTTPIVFRNWLVNPGGYTGTGTLTSLNLPTGTYTAQLSCQSINPPVVCTQTQLIVVPARPMAIFTVPANVCDATGFTFTSTSTPSTSILSYLWNFGDGTNLFKSTPTITAQKAYNFVNFNSIFSSLTTTDIYGCNSSFGPLPISVKQNLFTLNNVTVTPTSALVCQRDSAQLCALGIGATNTNTPYSYLWSNTATTSCIWAKLAGPYSVTFTDAYGCQSSLVNAGLNTIMIPNPVVSGDLSYCQGQTPQLSINLGAGYTYRWQYNYLGTNTTIACSSPLFPPPVNPCGAMTPSLPTNFTGTLTLRGIITETTSGLNCTAVGSSVNVVVRPLPPSPTVTPNQCQQPYAVNLSANAGSGYSSIIWNTGTQGTAISVSNAGKYFASVVDAYGCKSIADTGYVWPRPDFGSVVYGCYEVCDTGNITLPAPPGYAQYTWYKAGYGAIAGPSSTPINLVFSTPSTLPGGNPGTYSLALTTTNNCTGISPAINISTKSCKVCTLTANPIFQCVDDPNTGPYYNYTITLNNPGPAANYSVSCSNGNVSSVSGLLATGNNTLTGQYTGGGNSSLCCLNFTLQQVVGGQICKWNKCFQVPPCNPPVCNITPTVHILCKKMLGNGNAVYTYSVDFNYSGPGTGTVLLTSAQGNVTQNTSTVLPGFNTVYGEFEDTPTYDGSFCLNLYIAQASQGWCQAQKCVALPTSAPCFTVNLNCPDINVSLTDLGCPEFIGPGQANYTLSFMMNSTGFGYTFYILSNQGLLGTPSSTTISTAPTNYTCQFTQTQPLQGGALCFTVVATSVKNGAVCKKSFCIYPISCGGNNRLISNVLLDLYPNPANDQTLAEYVLDNLEPMDAAAGISRIELTDMSGRALLSRQLQASKGRVTFSTADLIPGLYMVRVMSGERILMVRKLVIQR